MYNELLIHTQRFRIIAHTQKNYIFVSVIHLKLKYNNNFPMVRKHSYSLIPELFMSLTILDCWKKSTTGAKEKK